MFANALTDSTVHAINANANVNADVNESAAGTAIPVPPMPVLGRCYSAPVVCQIVVPSPRPSAPAPATATGLVGLPEHGSGLRDEYEYRTGQVVTA